MKRAVICVIALLLSLGDSRARSLHGGAAVDYWFELSNTSTPRTTSSGGSSTSVVNDENVTTFTGASAQDDRQLAAPVSISKGGPGISNPVTWTSSDTSIATIDATTGKLTHVDANSSGTVTITATSALLTRSVTLALARFGGTTTSATSYATGALSKHLQTQIDTLISGKTGSSSTQNLFSSSNVRSTTWFGYGTVDLSCLAQNGNGGTLLSPRHFIQVGHSPIVTGQTLTFVSNDGNNTVITRTCLANSSGVAGPDINIGILSSDVPATVTYASTLPANVFTPPNNKFPSIIPPSGLTFARAPQDSSVRIPVLRLNQSKQVSVADVYSFGYWPQQMYYFFSCIYPLDSTRRSFYKEIIGGDSGNPCFLVVNGTPVLLSTWSNGGDGAGTLYQGSHAAIDSVMHSLSVAVSAGSDYQRTDANLSGFTSY